MFLVLAWLTVSLPFVTETKNSATTETSNPVDNTNPFAGTTEEKVPGSVNIAEEYMHHAAQDFSLIHYQISVAYIHAHESTYKAYHGEPPCPPPNFLS